MIRHASAEPVGGARAGPSGLDTPGSEQFRHLAMGFRGASTVLSAATPLLRAAVAREEAVWVAVDDPSRADLQHRLGRAASAGVVFADPAGDYGYSAQSTAARRAIQLRAATRVGGRATVLAQHGPRRDFGSAYWCEVEACCNVALTGVAVTMICLYPVDDGGRMTPAAYWNHPELLRGDTARPNPEHRLPEQVLASTPTPPAPPLGEPARRLDFGPVAVVALRDVRACAEQLGKRAELTASRREAAAVAVSELVSNTLEHGTGRGTVSWWVEPGRMIAEVHDAGRVRSTTVGLRPPTPAEPRGRGLWLARKLSSSLHIWTDPTGTHARCEI